MDSRAVEPGIETIGKRDSHARLPSKTHLDLCVVVKRPQEDLVIDAFVVGQMAGNFVSFAQIKGIWSSSQDLSQPQLPWWVPLQLHGWAEQDQEIRLTADMVAELRVNQVHVDLLLPDIALLCHLCQGSCQVNDRVAAVVFGEKQNGEVLAFFLKISVRVRGLGR